MDDQRLGTGAGGADMGAKALALPFQISNAAPAFAIFHAVVIKAGFTNRHHPRQRGATEQILHRGLGNAFVVGMHADGAPKIVVGQRQRVDAVKLFQRGANAQRPADLRRSHRLANGGQLIDQFRKIKVAM